MRGVVEAEMRGIVEAENVSATLDSLSPMHAETEGNEPNPSVQLCKFKSKKSGRRIGDKYNTRRNWNVEMCNWGEMLPGPWHGGPSLEDTDTLVSWLPIRWEWAIYAPLSSWHSAKYIHPWHLKYIHPWIALTAPNILLQICLASVHHSPPHDVRPILYYPVSISW